MGQKIIIRFWWESGLPSAFRNHLTTFCRPFVHYAVYKFNKENGKVFWNSIHSKNLKFSWVLYVLSQFVCSLARFDLSNRGVRQPVKPHTFYARLLIFDETLPDPHFAVAIALTQCWVCFTPLF